MCANYSFYVLHADALNRKHIMPDGFFVADALLTLIIRDIEQHQSHFQQDNTSIFALHWNVLNIE